MDLVAVGEQNLKVARAYSSSKTAERYYQLLQDVRLEGVAIPTVSQTAHYVSTGTDERKSPTLNSEFLQTLS